MYDAFLCLSVRCSSQRPLLYVLLYLVAGDDSKSLPPSEDASQSGVQETWNSVREDADQIIRSEQIVLSVHEVAELLSETIPQLQVEYDEIVDILLESGAPADQVAVAQRQSWLAERIVRSVNKVLAGGDDAVMAADAFGRDASQYPPRFTTRTSTNTLDSQLALS